MLIQIYVQEMCVVYTVYKPLNSRQSSIKSQTQSLKRRTTSKKEETHHRRQTLRSDRATPYTRIRVRALITPLALRGTLRSRIIVILKSSIGARSRIVAVIVVGSIGWGAFFLGDNAAAVAVVTGAAGVDLAAPAGVGALLVVGTGALVRGAEAGAVGAKGRAGEVLEVAELAGSAALAGAAAAGHVGDGGDGAAASWGVGLGAVEAGVGLGDVAGVEEAGDALAVLEMVLVNGLRKR